MKLFPAIDLYEGKAVRLLRGEYDKMTIYSETPAEVAKSFASVGTDYLHVVDLEGARDGTTANLETIRQIISESGLKVEVGGGIRSEEVIKQYLAAGVLRVILGTAAITRSGFVEEMIAKYGEQIAVGVDIKDGMVAIKGWTEVSEKSCEDFCQELDSIGVKTIICTDISKDGLLAGTNMALYQELNAKFSMDIVASGGVTSIDEIRQLCKMGMYGAILGKALYAGAIDLAEALKVARGENL